MDRSDLGLYYEMMVGDCFFLLHYLHNAFVVIFFGGGIFGRHNIRRIFGKKNIVGFGRKALFFIYVDGSECHPQYPHDET